MSNELPQGWCYAFLGELGELSRGKSKHRPRNDPKLYGDSIPFIQTGEVARSKGRISSFSKMYSEFGVQQSRVFPSRTVCITIAANIADTGILEFDACFPDSIVGLITDDRLADPYFVEYFLRIIREDLAQFAPATAQANINLEILNKVVVPLPPLNEQQQIVAKIEELRDRHQRAKQALEAIPELCDRFRQSVLAAAFRGDLTADWREENPNVEPASVLLKKIRRDRQQSLTKQKVNLEAINLSSLPKIPETWEWEKLVNISNLLGGVTKGRKFNGQTTVQVPYLRVANVQDGFLDLGEIKEIEVLPSDISKYRLEYGDILFTEGGDRDKLGRGTVWQNEIEGCIHQNHVYRARLYNSEILSDYISLAAKTEYAKDYFFQNASQTVNLASINITTLGNLPLPIPPLEEQKEICKRVYQLFQIANSVRVNHQSLLSHLDRLNQSILAKAFRGELVEQDPNDEPASVLLERIRAEREKADNGKKTKGKRAKQLKLEV